MHTKTKTRLMIIWLILASVILCAFSITLIFAENNAKQSLGVGMTFTTSTNNLAFTLNSDKKSYSVSAANSDISGDIYIPKTYTNEDGVTGPVTTISSSAFNDKSAITKIVISKSITSIAGGAFQNCSGLTSLEVDKDNKTYHSSGNCIIETASKTLIAGCKTSEIPADGTVTIIGEKAFYNCKNLESITIPNTITNINDYAFYYCSALTGTLNIPNSVTSIGYEAFYYCSGLKDELNIPISITNIGSYAFEYCSGLTSVKIPEIVATVGGYVFAYCTGLENAVINSGKINYAGGVGQVAERMFEGCSKLLTVTLPQSPVYINAAAFRYCSSLTTVNNSENICSVSWAGFGDCIALTRITVGGSAISGYAFSHCEALESVTLLDGLKYIGVKEKNTVYTYAFQYCIALKSIVIPDSVEIIYEYAFQHCTGLESLTIGSGVTEMGKGVFNTCTSLLTATINSEKINKGSYTYGIIPEETFKDCSILTTVTLPAGPVCIGTRAFQNCYDLSIINNMEWILQVNYAGFENCTGLTSISFGKCSGLTLNDYAFKKCTKLTTVTMPTSGVVEVNYCAFQECTALTTVNNPIHGAYNYSFDGCGELTSITIASTDAWSGTGIGYCAFRNCKKLVSIVLPKYLTSIDNYAFESCPSTLKVYYNGTASEWNNITIKNLWSKNNPIVNATKYYYSETQPSDTSGNYWHYNNGEIEVWST